MLVVWTGPAQKALARLDRPIAGRVMAAVDRLAETGQGNVTQLRGAVTPAFRLRMGDWRVIFTIDEAADELVVKHVGHRREVYR